VIYKSPEEDMRDFLAERMSLLSGFERLESIEFARALLDSKEGGERPKVITICKHFSWLKKIGVLDYERVMGKCGGMRLVLFRSCTASDAVKIISGHEDHAPEKNEKVPPPVSEPVPTPSGDAPAPPLPKADASHEPSFTPPLGGLMRGRSAEGAAARMVSEYGKPARKKKRERCCSNYKPVRSKKTGRRRCKSCGAELPDKKSAGGHSASS